MVYTVARKIDPDLIPPFPTLEFETEAWKKGNLRVAGVDEAGRGALAGPIYAVAVVLPPDEPDLEKVLFGVRDSKQLSYPEREQWSITIREVASDLAVGWVESEVIDQIGIAGAGVLVFERAIAGLKHQPGQLLLDYFKTPNLSIPQLSLVKGDQRSLSIACASILAKQARDQRMVELSGLYPDYHFEHNKGYGTPEHLEAIDKFGLCPLHRLSFTEHLLQGKLFDF